MKHHHLQPTPPKRVMILGANGFIARDLARLLAEMHVPHVLVGSAQLDLLATDATERLRDTIQAEDAVVMTSALTPEHGKDVQTFMKNITMAASVCAFLETGRCAQMVYLSSDAVYDDAQALVSEATPRTGLGLYGLMHAAREQMLGFSAAKCMIPLCILRPGAIYGAGDTHNSYGPNRFFRAALKDGKISLFGTGEEQRDHICIGDVSRFITLILARRTEGAIHIATGQSITFDAVAQMIAKLCARPVLIENHTRPAGGVITHRHFDVSLRLQEFPEFRVMPLVEGLAKMGRELVNR